MFNKSICVVSLAVLLVSFLEKDIYAYIDPGTGSYVFQVTIAFLITAVFTVKSFWSRIKLFIVNMFSKQEIKNDKHS